MRRLITYVLTATVVAGWLAIPANAAVLTLGNPDWEIIVDDFGYSDLLLDKVPGREGREYLSGEWAAALGYKVGGILKTPTWLEPDFIFPDWTTNSDFTIATPITPGPLNAFGLPTAFSAVSNADIAVRLDYEMIDTIVGIEQGATPASSLAPSASVTSNRYILKQTYIITNMSGMVITELQGFQFLHGLESQVALYDDRDYGGPFGAYKYDTFEVGTSTWFALDPNDPNAPLQMQELEDVITFHSSLEPSAVEVGFYGRSSVDDHAIGKPSVGVHWSVEGNSLSGLDFFDPSAPDELWVSGAQRYELGTLGIGEAISFDVLLSIQTEVVPEPCTVVVIALGGLAMLRRRKRQS